jgi:HEAT repeat protein
MIERLVTVSVIDRLASALGRRDEEPNLLLAREIAEQEDREAVQELVDHLDSKDKEIQSDSIKVLYEIGALRPDLIRDYVDEFVALLRSRNNRLVWGGMTALGAVAAQAADEIGKHLDQIINATRQGSVITQDWGVRVLAAVALADESAYVRVFPFLMDFFRTCSSKDLPRHAESVLPAVRAADQQQLVELLKSRRLELKAAQSKRLDSILKKINGQ